MVDELSLDAPSVPALQTIADTRPSRTAGAVRCGGARTSPQGIGIVRSELEKLGWFEGRDIVFEHRVAQGDYTLLPSFAAELVAMGVRVILAVQSPSTVAATEAIRTIPI